MIKMLEENGFKVSLFNSDGIKAAKEDNYRKVIQTREKLEKEGFSWSERE